MIIFMTYTLKFDKLGINRMFVILSSLIHFVILTIMKALDNGYGS